MAETKTVAYHTLGCKLNFAETSTIARSLGDAGYKKVSFDVAADVYVINTCSVTENANRECRQIVRKALRNSPDAFVAVIGCYAQLKPEEIAAIDGVDLVLGASEKFNLDKYLASAGGVEGIRSTLNKALIHSCEINEVHEFVNSYSQAERTRAYLKVQDGCDYSCAFCTIPMARGESRSDSIENVVANAENLGKDGVKEIVLTGINIGDFGTVHATAGAGATATVGTTANSISNSNTIPTPSPSESFYQLISKLDQINSISRFRISSIEPNLLTKDIIEFVANSARFMPHFHIPLQSGSNKILRKMKRRYLKELYEERVAWIKELIPDCCIGVDVIVGFPGETEDDFMETFEFLKKLDISYLHVFTYSERDNTEAIKMSEVVPLTERKVRNRILRNLSEKKRRAFYQEHLNSSRPILFESENKDNTMFGFTDNYIKVVTKFDQSLSNEIIVSKLADINTGGLAIIEEPSLHLI
ncbi:MAG: MiaB/RimO family radical SAM methylthiotransferase [Bacteroidetes bacterium]|nr:MiaB/RimO family radical SAM methylthiotransferase [Bacteroidota bacterium]